MRARTRVTHTRVTHTPTPFGEPGEDLSDKAPLVRELACRSDAAKTDMMQEYRGKLREVEEVDDAVDRLMNTLVETRSGAPGSFSSHTTASSTASTTSIRSCGPTKSRPAPPSWYADPEFRRTPLTGIW
jgi:hypothetical protein